MIEKALLCLLFSANFLVADQNQLPANLKYQENVNGSLTMTLVNPGVAIASGMGIGCLSGLIANRAWHDPDFQRGLSSCYQRYGYGANEDDMRNGNAFMAGIGSFAALTLVQCATLESHRLLGILSSIIMGGTVYILKG